KQGRVWSIISTITYLGSIVAFVVAGFLADKVFNPLLEVNGKLAGTVGSIIGIGESRGIGLMLIVSGIIISFISLLIFKNTFIKK
ncbi:MAG: MFS transporter, partial [Asgard group archaeon]|nr:MFS transporter [Asgard group archaeon]